MNIKDISLKKIKPYKKNAKLHPDDQVQFIANSIKEFGWKQPIVLDKDNVIVIGHGRFLAAKKLGLESAPCIYADDLSEDQIKALRLADNKTNESEWDLDLMNFEIDDIGSIDMELFGFDLSEEEEETEIIEDEVPEIPEEPKSILGDLYLIGRHKLLCADSTSLDSVGRLMDGELANLVVTDPPYNMDYQGAGNTKNRDSKKIMNDNMSDQMFYKFLRDMYHCYYNYMEDGASIYVFYKELGNGVFIRTMVESGLTFKQELIWVKNHLVLGGSKYQSIYEPFLMGCKGKTIKTWHGGRKQTNVIESFDLMNEDELRDTIKEILDSINTDIVRENKQVVNDLHPTMKPVRLNARLIQNSSNKDDIVLDLFAGSGSTMIASEQLNRSCYMCELDPRFVDVIVQRYVNFVGSDEHVALIRNGEVYKYQEIFNG